MKPWFYIAIAWLQLDISFSFLCVTAIGATNFALHPPHFHNLFPRELFGVSALDFLWSLSSAFTEPPGRCYSFPLT